MKTAILEPKTAATVDRVRHWKAPEHVERVKAAITAAVRHDLPIKAIAINVGLSEPCVVRWIGKLGYTRIFLSSDERRLIMTNRERETQHERALTVNAAETARQ